LRTGEGADGETARGGEEGGGVADGGVSRDSSAGSRCEEVSRG
jgi:hypothetical protein